MGTNVEQWRPLVATYFAAELVPTALCIMAAESGGNPTARNTTSGAAGLFQHLPKYWASRSVAAGWAGADIYDPTANVAVAAWLQREGGWGHWSPWNRGACR
jgi:soluble lytic murein transglycosylase-like protein